MIVTVEELKQELNLTADLGIDDDALIARKLAAAQGHIEHHLGFKIEERYGDSAEAGPVPDPLKQAVCLLAAHWYENREATLIGVTAQGLPFGVDDIVRNFREWTFG